MNSMSLQSEFEGSLEEWDVHVGRCNYCLVQGNGQCFEGNHLSERVARVRGSLLKAEIRNRIHSPIPVNERRPIFPGAPA
jgi:hypothetical protein